VSSVQSSIPASSSQSSSSTANQSLPCTPPFSCFLDDDRYTFQPRTSTQIYGINKVDLGVAPSRYSAPPLPGNKFVCRFQLRVESSASNTDPLGGFSANVNKLTGGANPIQVSQNNNGVLDTYQVDYNNNTGGCTTTLPANQQVTPKWTYTIQTVEVNSTTNAVAGNLFQAKPSYFLLFGAIGVVVIG